MPISKKPVVSRKPVKRSPAPAKVFDVARPGKTAATSTSKPVIITNRPVIQDPMVTATTSDEPSTAPVLTPVKKLVIKPMHSNIVPEKTAIAAPPVTPAESSPEDRPAGPANTDIVVPPALEAVTVKVDQVVSDKPEPSPNLEPAAIDLTQPVDGGSPTHNPQVADTMVKQPAMPPSQPSNTSIAVPTATDDRQFTPAEAAAAVQANQDRSAQLQRIIDKEQYFLPINAREDRRNRRWAIFGLVLVIVLGAAWYDVALDASLLSNTYNIPHSHFFTARSH